MRDPFSREAEQGVIGAMLINPELIDVLSADLTAEDFYWPEHAELYRGILGLRAEGKQVDYVTLGERVPEVQTKDGGVERGEYLAMLISSNTPSAANAKTYSEIVRERAVDRAMVKAAQQITEIAHSAGEMADKVGAAQSLVMQIDNKTSRHEVMMISDVMSEHVDEWQRRHDLGGKLDGLSTGVIDLDSSLNGLKAGDMIVIAGRPAMGKTSFAMNIAEFAAVREKKSVLVVSLEMTNGGLVDRIVSSVGKIPLKAIKDGSVFGNYGKQINDAVAIMNQTKLAMSDRPGLTIAGVRAMARRHKMIHGLDLLVLDYLQLLTGTGKANRVEDVSDMSRQCKLMARELEIPVIILSQLNRSLESRPNKRPMMSDLRESGAIEQDADVIMFIYRDEVYNPESDCKGTAEIIIGKSRNGEPGTVRCAFQGQFCKFENLAHGWRPEQKAQQSSGKVTSFKSKYKEGF